MKGATNAAAGHSIWIHPGDVLDEGPERAFAAIREMGLREISLAATYHAARFLLPHSGNGAVRELEDGVAWYQPDPARWKSARLQPKAAAACGGRDWFREARDAAAKAGLAVNAWIVALHDGRLGAAHPECAIVNVFGDRYAWGLCPSHPDARAYAIGLAEEIATRYAPAALELESFGFMGYSHRSHHDKAGVELDGAHDFLLSLCVCDACARRMATRQVDVKRLAEKARRLVKEYLDRGGPAGARLDKAEEIGPWLVKALGPKECASVLSVRKETVVTLLEEARRRVPKGVKLHAMAHPSPFVTGAAIGGGLLALGDVADAFVLNLFHGDAARMRAEVKSARTAATPATRFFANLRAFPPDSPTEASFLEKVAAVRAEGLETLRVYHYALLPRAHFAWVRTALGAARSR
jgi:hypothetical protein